MIFLLNKMQHSYFATIIIIATAPKVQGTQTVPPVFNFIPALIHEVICFRDNEWLKTSVSFYG